MLINATSHGASQFYQRTRHKNIVHHVKHATEKTSAPHGPEEKQQKHLRKKLGKNGPAITKTKMKDIRVGAGPQIAPPRRKTMIQKTILLETMTIK